MITQQRHSGQTHRCGVCGQLNTASATACERCGSLMHNDDFSETGPAAPLPSAVSGQGSTGLEARPRPSLSQQCAVCGQLNRPGVLLCEACGTNLATGERAPISTRALTSTPINRYDGLLDDITIEGRDTLDVGMFYKGSKSGTSVFENNMILRLQIDGFPRPLLLKLTQQHPLIFGRRDQSTPDVDVDLTPYAAYNRGISRHHAGMELTGKRLEIWDLNSSNGTYLNGNRLDSEHRHQLRDSDEIRFGQMVIQLFFQHRVERD